MDYYSLFVTMYVYVMIIIIFDYIKLLNYPITNMYRLLHDNVFYLLYYLIIFLNQLFVILYVYDYYLCYLSYW